MSDVDAWESAYRRFETPEQEKRKFVKRLTKLGAGAWPADSAIVELCCGRGSGLTALERLGFTNIHGIDISADLLGSYQGAAACHVADCRALPFEDRSADIVVVHGGLHHLLELPDDLRRTISEAHRVLRDRGRLVLVEPWLTPFLRVVHTATNRRLLRRAWTKLDALATMIEHERVTYEQWLTRPDAVRAVVSEFFEAEQDSTRLGKWAYVGPRRVLNPASTP